MKSVLTAVLLGTCLCIGYRNCRRRAGKCRGNEHAAKGSGDYTAKS